MEALSDAQALDWLKALLDACLKGALLVAVLAAASLFMRRMSASQRSVVWTAALMALLLLPLTSVLTPGWRIGLFPDPSPTALPPAGVDALKDSPSGLVTGETNEGRPSPPETRTDPSRAATAAASAGGSPAWPFWVLAAWLTGVAGAGLWLAFGKLGGWIVIAKSKELRDDSWCSLLQQASAELGLSRRVRLLCSDKLRVALTAGLVRPVIVVPTQAEGWTAQQRRMLLLHELAHVKRLDPILDFLAQAVMVLYWFNPLAWLALRRFRAERERACDDAVLRAGARPSDYATQLMEIAALLGSAARPLWHAAVISMGSSLKDRLLRILDPRIQRQAARQLFAVAAFVAVVALALPLSAFSFWSPPEVSGEQAIPAQESAAGDLSDRMVTSLARGFLESGRIESAIGVYRLNCALHPNSPGAYLELAEAYMRQYCRSHAITFYRKVLTLEPDNARALEMLERLGAESGNPFSGD